MTPILRYGLNASVAIEPCEATLLGCCGSPEVEPVDDIAAEVARSLSSPLDYPSLSAIVTPGDRIVLALANEVPTAAEIVAAVVDYLVAHRVDPEAITVLRSARSADDDPCRLLSPELRELVASLVHTPNEREQLAYLATTDDGHAVLLHRAIVDADLVLPIGCFRGNVPADYHGLHTPIYPTFSDRQTQHRFHGTTTLDSRGRRRKRLGHEADEVGWLLGISFTIQVIPAVGNRPYRILSGQNDAVRHQAMQLYAELWQSTVPRRADVVLAAIDGDTDQQTWVNLGRTLETAAALVNPGGGIAVCTELSKLPGAAVNCLKAARSNEEALQQIHRDEPDDAVAAVQLARALDHCSVYLLSRLDDSLVEDLDMMPIDSADELIRLANRCESLLLLGNASYARVTVEEPSDE